jgi:hypothetical protein
MTISRDDIEAKAMEIVGAVDETKESARDTAIVAGVVVAVVVAVAFLVGRRRGARNRTMVEVYRV